MHHVYLVLKFRSSSGSVFEKKLVDYGAECAFTVLAAQTHREAETQPL